MANIITYPTVTPASTDLVIGNYINTDGISETKTFTVASIAASGGGSSVTSLNDLTDCLIDTASEYIGTVPSGLSGNPQGNTTLGIGAGDGLTTGNKNTLIGNDAGSTLTTAQNSIVIGYDAEPSAATTSNEITLGNANITSLRIPGLQSGATDGDVLTFSSSTNNITLKSASLTKLVTVTTAQILALSGGVNDFELIAAPGAGKIIVIDSVLAFLDFNSVAYTITGAGGIFLGFTPPTGAGNISLFIDNTADSYLNAGKETIGDPQANAAFQLKNNGNAITLGNSPLKFNIVYRILDATTLA